MSLGGLSIGGLHSRHVAGDGGGLAIHRRHSDAHRARGDIEIADRNRGDGGRFVRGERNQFDAGAEFFRQTADAQIAVAHDGGGVFDGADVGDVERAERHRADRENDAEPLGVAEDLFLDRFCERIEIDGARDHVATPSTACVKIFCFQAAATLSGEFALESDLKTSFTE